MTVESRNGISRRSLVKGAAWALPAVAIATAAPAFAISAGPVLPSIDLGLACKQGNGPACGPQKFSYAFPITLKNTTSSPVEFQITSFKKDGTERGVWGIVTSRTSCAQAPLTAPRCAAATAKNAVTIPANTSSMTLWVISNDTGNNSNSSLALSWRIVDPTTTGCPVIVSNTVSHSGDSPICA